MKVLNISNVFPPQISGQATAAEELANALHDLGIEVEVLTTQSFEDNKFDDSYPYQIHRLNSLKTPFREGKYSIMPLANNVKKVIKRGDFDILHIHEVMSPLYWQIKQLAKRYKLPFIATHHFIPGFVEISLRKDLGKFIGSSADKLVWQQLARAYKGIDHIITPTEFVKQVLLEHGVEGDMTVISNGVHLPELKFEQANAKFLHKQLGLDEQAKILMYFGRVDKDKRLDKLVDAWKKLTDYKGWQLVLCGKGDHLDYLKQISENHENIHFYGYVEDEDVDSVYRSASAYSMSSPYEAQSITTLEAMSYYLPIVANNRGAVVELVDDGRNGLVYDFHDAEQFVEKLAQLVNLDDQQLQAMSIESRHRAEAHDIRNLGTNTVKVYEQVLSDV